MPRQWAWLNSQPGGASVALRALVDAAAGNAPTIPAIAADPAAADPAAAQPAATDPATADRFEALRRVMNVVPTMARDPGAARACVEIAREAGVAPPLVAAPALDAALDPALRLRRLETLVRTVKALHEAPLFPIKCHFLDGVAVLIDRVQAAGVLPAPLLKRIREFHGEIASSYPRRECDLVSSHTRLHPGNVGFEGVRPWIVNWESAHAADRYVDLASIANFFADHPDDEDYVLNFYFGPGFDVCRRSRLYLMQQANRLFHALTLLHSVAASWPGTQVSAADLTAIRHRTPRFRDLSEHLASMSLFDGRLQLACVMLNEALFHFEDRRFLESALCATWAGQLAPE